jgi:hypothetical protein
MNSNGFPNGWLNNILPTHRCKVRCSEPNFCKKELGFIMSVNPTKPQEIGVGQTTSFQVVWFMDYNVGGVPDGNTE